MSVKENSFCKFIIKETIKEYKARESKGRKEGSYLKDAINKYKCSCAEEEKSA